MNKGESEEKDTTFVHVASFKWYLAIFDMILRNILEVQISKDTRKLKGASKKNLVTKIALEQIDKYVGGSDKPDLDLITSIIDYTFMLVNDDFAIKKLKKHTPNCVKECCEKMVWAYKMRNL